MIFKIKQPHPMHPPPSPLFPTPFLHPSPTPTCLKLHVFYTKQIRTQGTVGKGGGGIFLSQFCFLQYLIVILCMGRVSGGGLHTKEVPLPPCFPSVVAHFCLVAVAAVTGTKTYRLPWQPYHARRWMACLSDDFVT